MIRHARLLPVLLLAPLLLTACGTEKAGSDAPATATPATATPATATPTTATPTTATPATAGAAAPEPDPAELAARAQALGIAPELVYVTEAPGFTLAQQSVGVLGDDGFSATWFAAGTGALLRLSVERGSITAATCTQQQVGDMPSDDVTCERDGDAWYRTGAGQHEYAVPEDGHVVRVTADQGAVSRDVLHAAARAAHRPDAAEVTDLLPSAEPAPTAPIERGDLPPNGDGAPDNHVEVGG